MVRACVQEQKSFNFYDWWLRHAAYYHAWCLRHADAADAAWSICSVALCGLSVLVSVRQLHHDRARLRAMSKATTGLQWLMVTSTSAMGGQTATLDHDGTHYLVLR